MSKTKKELKGNITEEQLRRMKAEISASLARDRHGLLVYQPFVGNVAMRFDLVPVRDKRCRTACTDSKTIYFDCDFYSKLNDQERKFVLAHEIWHSLTLTFARRMSRDPDLFNVASDMEINNILVGDGAESGGCSPPPDLRYPPKHLKGKSAEIIYEWLLKQQQKNNLNSALSGIPKPGRDGYGSGSDDSDDDDDSAFTYRLNGENVTLVREGVTYNYTYKILNGALYFYDEDGEIGDVFYREDDLPARGYTGASVGGEWGFDVSDVDYSDMYDAMMGAAYDASGVSETVRRIMQDAQYKEALREPITDLLNDYEFDFRSDGSVYITIDTDDYIKFMARTTEAMIPLLRALTIEEAADYYGISVAELEQYLANNGMTWDQHVDGIASTYSEVNAEFDEYSVAEVLGGTLNAYGDVELYAGSFTQNGDRVTMTGSGGGVTVFVFDDDDTLLLDGISGSGSEMAMFCAMEGLKFVR